MSSYILCQVKRASMPYYIENISTNIYSIEELCYYFYHNIYLLDETILNEHLCDWLRKELGLEKLYKRLYKVLEEGLGTSEFILAVFKEINYLTYEELKEWYEKSGLPLKRFFNTSGNLYKQMNLKDKLKDMSEEEQLKLLATDGMLVKRPLVIADEFVLTGFKEKEWEEKIL